MNTTDRALVEANLYDLITAAHDSIIDALVVVGIVATSMLDENNTIHRDLLEEYESLSATRDGLLMLIKATDIKIHDYLYRISVGTAEMQGATLTDADRSDLRRKIEGFDEEQIRNGDLNVPLALWTMGMINREQEK